MGRRGEGEGRREKRGGRGGGRGEGEGERGRRGRGAEGEGKWGKKERESAADLRREDSLISLLVKIARVSRTTLALSSSKGIAPSTTPPSTSWHSLAVN